MNEIVLAIIQPVLLVTAAPLFSGVSRVLRAKMHTRKGPSVFQDYYDIIKLFKREDVRTRDSGVPFRIMPVLFLATVLLLAMGMPMITRFCPIPALGDFIVVVYLLALPRFFFALSSIDSSGSYPGVGGIRELLASTLIEPSMIIALFSVAIATGCSNIGAMGDALSSLSFTSPIAMVVAAFAFCIACYMELGKLPYDVAEAEQELQEGPLAEYSGPSLAMIKLAMSLKQIIVISMLLAIFFPLGSAVDMAPASLAVGLLVFCVKVSVVFTLCALIENTVARVRFRLLSQHTWMVVGCSVLSLAFLVMGI
ncbi:MAG: NADH-quinone oxidoreductase subunit H [Gordonibacter sp.]|nr:NADH-quinone oxidoreductase subunit H [Gordonibacter sp.]